MRLLLIRSLAIGAAGFVGTIARFLIATFFKQFNPRFPIGTFFINITGSLFLGWFFTFATARNLNPVLSLAISVGFVGGYTTFSTFMFESNSLFADGAVTLGFLNLIGSLIVGLLAVQLGIMLARWMS
jgi:fluoride exporter